ncbi:hypothetical protein A5819_002253 [Enterococcus sp. 7E2_DIV0204]|uniref:C2H2-type domain-containing protein n=1 Tax=Candidatus Enterococcus lemimoniae TaxID=1834167 RepID=A0ABZ2T422_9ENTE|nr:hypothetical protein A5819_002253 [Enterococcus sp. 7E2_DIV0204]
MGYDFFKQPIYQKKNRYHKNSTYYIDCECKNLARKQYNKNIYLCPTCGKAYSLKNNTYHITTHYVGLK